MMTQQLKERIAEMQGRMAAVDDNIETMSFKMNNIYDELNQRMNEHTQHTDLLQSQVQVMKTSLDGLASTNKVLLKLLGKLLGDAE